MTTPEFLGIPYERVVYDKNPLVQVICQLRFPHLLTINATPPADFQNAILSSYPILEVREGVEVTLHLEGDLPQSPIRPSSSYAFFSSDREWQIVLTTGFVSLVSHNYKRWEDFRARLEQVSNSLLASYTVSEYTRIGLRYRDIIDRSDLGLTGRKWSELLRPAVVGWLGEGPCGEDAVRTFTSDIAFEHGDVRFRVRSGLVRHEQTKDIAFLLDTDYYKSAKIDADTSKALEHADKLHRYAGPFFRWCIQSDLHRALGPKAVED